MPDIPKIADRIKELTYTSSTANSFVLAGSVAGFSSFSNAFSTGDTVFYAVTDGQKYEVGSGVFTSSASDSIFRFPIKSSNADNSKADFGTGVKEIYSTYPATNAVLMGSGVDTFTMPEAKGVAFWGSNQVLNYDSNIIWDSTNNRLGINKAIPLYSIDVGDNGTLSVIRSSGVHVGSSGIVFPSGTTVPGYSGGRQLEHFQRNDLADSHIQAVLEVSGIVSQHLWLKKQNEGAVLAGPSSSCGCSPSYPTFRVLTASDIPDLTTASGALNFKIAASGENIISEFKAVDTAISGYLQNTIMESGASLISISGYLQNTIMESGADLRSDDVAISGSFVAQDTAISGYLQNTIMESGGSLQSDDVAISGYLQNTIMESGASIKSDEVAISGYLQEMVVTSGTSLRADDVANSGFVVEQFVNSGSLDAHSDFLTVSGMTPLFGGAPSAKTDSGTVGQIRMDANYIYVCIATNTWKRVQIADWP